MGNHHHQDATWLEPTEAVLKEDRLHPLVSTLPNFKVVGRIQIQDGKGLDRGMAVEHASMNSLLQPSFRLVRAKCIEFDSVATISGLRRDRGQSNTGSGARIK